MVVTFVIFLREGIAASMIVAILLSYLGRIGQRRHFTDVYLGVASALILVVVGGVAVYLFVHQYDGSDVQTYFETATYVVATAALTFMTLWMAKHARTMSAELQTRSELALSTGSRWGVGLLAFQAVGREGLETMVFTLAIVFSNSNQAAPPVHGDLLLVGAVLGLAVALAIALAIYRVGARLNLRRFFRVLGVVLMVFAAGLLVDAVQNLQQLGWLPLGRRVLWDSSGTVLESSNLGDVLHSLVGYADRPTVLQAVAWLAYVVVSVAAFLRLSRAGAASAIRGEP